MTRFSITSKDVFGRKKGLQPSACTRGERTGQDGGVLMEEERELEPQSFVTQSSSRSALPVTQRRDSPKSHAPHRPSDQLCLLRSWPVCIGVRWEWLLSFAF